MRRMFDVTLAGLLLLLTAPVLLALVVWVRLDSPGPALFCQERIGLGRRSFTLLKFRSMVASADDAAHRRLIEAELFPPEYAGRFTVRPGLTGLWQVSGRSTVGTLEMLQMDLAYVAGRGMRNDLRILLLTIPALFRGDGAR